jgi:hypothetical protein
MRFYVLEARIGSEYETEFVATADNVGEAPRCPSCGRHVGSLPWSPPFNAEVTAHGRAYGDVAFGAGCELLLSETAVQAFASLPAFPRAEPASITVPVGTAAGSWPAYFVVRPCLTAVAIDEGASKVFREPRALPLCSRCSAPVGKIDGFAIDESSWEGEHLFRSAHLVGVTIVTQRLVDIAEQSRLRNVTATPSEEYLYDPYDVET